MEVTLKKVKTFTGREGIGLNADVCVNGVKCFAYIDDASGGESHHYPYNKELYQQLKEYVKTLPERKALEEFGPGAMFKPDIDTLINDALAKHEVDKLIKRLMKQTVNKIIFVSDDGKYVESKWGSIGIDYVVKNAPDQVKSAVENLKNKYPGWKLINTNIPSELLK